MATPSFKFDLAATPGTAPLLLLAHGAGAGMDSAFLETIAKALAARGVSVARFEFGYMAGRREGLRKPPPKMDALAAKYRTAIAAIRAQHPKPPLFIGGKSMGGRVASLIAAELFEQGTIGGCVCLGYPFHPAKQPEKLRTAHLADMACPTLIVQGERDALGNRADVDGYTLSKQITVAWLGDGDHDFKPRVASGLTQAANIDAAADTVAAWATRRSPPTAEAKNTAKRQR